MEPIWQLYIVWTEQYGIERAFDTGDKATDFVIELQQLVAYRAFNCEPQIAIVGLTPTDLKNASSFRRE